MHRPRLRRRTRQPLRHKVFVRGTNTMDKSRPIIIIKKKGGHGGHHGGAWKVAYADFVTAMMALFIVLWLLNSSKQIQVAVGVISRIQPERRKKSVPTWWAREKILSSLATICPSSRSNCRWPSSRCRIEKK
jgi:Membrane MotB of proton-channel complex MotA/MotB